MTDPQASGTRGGAKGALLDAAVTVIRQRGLHATSVDELCRAAGVTKGAFFHHFASKEDLAVAAAEHWADSTGQLFADAPYHQPEHPADRVLGYLDFRADLIAGEAASYTCLVGTMAQEAYLTAPAVRDACARSIFGHAETLESDIEAALQLSSCAEASEVNAASLARHTQAVIQGGFVLAKAADDPQVALEQIHHLRRYLAYLLARPSAAAVVAADFRA